jgi:hypothetical protein
VSRRGAALLALAACCAAAPATAATVFRCGPDGREYSQTPCKDGRPVDVADPRGVDQQREAREVAESQSRLARQLEAERRQREAAAAATARPGMRGAGPQAAADAAPKDKPAARPANPSSAKPAKKASKDPAAKDFVARVPTSPPGAVAAVP